MKQQLKKALLFMTICFIFGLSSCEKDLYEDQIQNSNRKITISYKNYNELLADKTFSKVYQKIVKSEPPITSTGRTPLENLYGFTIVPEVAAKIFIEDDGTTTYNILIQRGEKEDLKFENLIIKEKSNETQAWIKKYVLSQPPVKVEAHNSYSLYIESSSLEALIVDGQMSRCGDIMVTITCDDTFGGQYSHDHTMEEGICNNQSYWTWNFTLTPCSGSDTGSTGSTGGDSNGGNEGNNGGDGNNNNTNGNNNSGGEGTNQNQGQTGGSGNNQEEIITTPVIFEIEVEAPDHCISLDKLLINSSIRNKIISLRNGSSSYAGELGASLKHVGANDVPVDLPPSLISNGESFGIDILIGGSIFGAIHTHPVDAASMFSFADLEVLAGLHTYNTIGNREDVVYMLATQDGVYALKIDNISVLRGFIYEYYMKTDVMRLSDKDDKKKEVNEIFNDETKRLGYERGFLQEMLGKGVSLYKAQDNVTRWEKLDLPDDPNSPILKRTNCN